MIKDFDLPAFPPTVPYQKPRGEWRGAAANYVVDTLLARIEELEEQVAELRTFLVV